jgi:hypothetical protein
MLGAANMFVVFAVLGAHPWTCLERGNHICARDSCPNLSAPKGVVDLEASFMLHPMLEQDQKMYSGVYLPVHEIVGFFGAWVTIDRLYSDCVIFERHIGLVLVRIFETPVVFIFESEKKNGSDWPADQYSMRRMIGFHTVRRNAPFLHREIHVPRKISMDVIMPWPR